MNIAIDQSPLKLDNLLQHRVRGTGFYIKNLKKALIKYYPKKSYKFFVRGEKLSKSIDLVHYTYFEPFFLTLPFFNKTKTVVTVHDLTPLVFPKYFPVGIKGAIKWQIQKLALSRMDAIITDSESSKNDIIKYANIPSAKINTVYLAASSSFKVIKDRKLLEKIHVKYNLPEKFVLYVGDVTWNKNLPRLVQAIKKINVNLVMIGKALVNDNFDSTNPWNQDLVNLRKLTENDKRFIKLGFLEEEDLVGVYNLANVFTMPSIYEGFGLPVVEAMTCGTPVVTSKEGSLQEVADNAVFYVDPYTINSIANGISNVFTSKKLQKELSQKGLNQAKKFSWKKTAQDTIKVYEKS